MLFFRQIWILIVKNILIILVRHPVTTILRCFLLPLIFTWFLSYARNLFIPPSIYGIGTPTPVRSLANALAGDGGTRNTVALVDNGFKGGDIEKVITQVASAVTAAGKSVEILDQEDDLLLTCRNSLRGVSSCFGAVVFFASPTEGPGGMWNYSLRADGALGTKIVVTNADNDAEMYPIPLQHAVDFAIASQNTTIDQSAVPTQVLEYPYTSMTQAQRNDNIRTRYMGGIIQILAVAFFIGIVGVIYQLVGLMASERELGMTQIIEASMPNRRRWEPQIVRLIALHIAFDIMFAPGWIAIGIILKYGVFAKTSLATLLIFNLLTGLSLSSFAIFGAAFFHKAQLSGIVTTILSLLLGILAQILVNASNGAVAILSLLFPPMNYTFFTILVARWERKDLPTNLVRSAPENWTLPGIAFFVFLIIQILAFPLLGALVERTLYGTASKGRQISNGGEGSQAAVQLSGYTKCYRPSWWARNITARFGKPKETVTAVDNLNLTIQNGQIMVLLGANGSGKSTTLEAIAGLNTVTSGTVAVDGFGGLGICPQKNILWDDLTAFEHVKIFNRLKSTERPSTKQEIDNLLRDCDLDRKVDARARHLSGGQKRKLQLSMMFTGGSKVCCVDECSSGVDALARKKLWSILLNERGKRTIIFTSHFLDEADLLSDQIAILSKGTLKAQGSSPELKHRLGQGFRIHVFKTPGEELSLPSFEGIQTKQLIDQIIYTLPESGQAARFIQQLEAYGIKNYEISSPTIEEVFFNVAEESIDSLDDGQTGDLVSTSPAKSDARKSDGVVITLEKASGSELPDEGMKLQTGKRTSGIRQAMTLFRKRWTVVQRNYLPSLAALLLPIIAAGLVTIFLKGFTAIGCSPTQDDYKSDINSLLTQVNYDLVIGPSSKLAPDSLALLEATLPGGNSSGSGLSSLVSAVHIIDGTLEDFNNYISQKFANVTPGGFYIGDGTTTFAYQGNADLSLATITQNALDTLSLNVSISSQYQAFDVPWNPGFGKASEQSLSKFHLVPIYSNFLGARPLAPAKTLQLVVYFGLVMSAFPAFFSLYPTLERLRNVRQLHYSNGVRSVCLWSAYLAFDFVIVIAVSVLSIIIFRGASDAWYHPEYLFVVLFCYGAASTLLSYVISLFARSQLAAFAFAAGGQAVMFLLYFIAYLSVITYASANQVDHLLLVTHFTIGLITPSGNLIRALFVALNIFSTACDNQSVIASYPGKITLYGGPILYLIGQSIFLFGILLWWDSGSIWARIRRQRYKPDDVDEVDTGDDEILSEIRRVNTASGDGLRVQHITKAYGKNVAVQDVTFGVPRGEVFALLGPNGAGKSTTISLIRGDILPSHTSGEIYVEDIPVSKQRAAARNHLGVCPQVDACDQMTVLEHLRFYARVRGVQEVENNVREVIRAVGLLFFQNRMAAKLSGGNKRKLSLAIALMGNPSVLLLDEPSSGMDVVSKRKMWQILSSVASGRSIVLTTHSMEEADALADRAGIMGKKMLALGTSEALRRKYGDRHHVHLIMADAPHTPDEEMSRIKDWIRNHLDGADIEDRTFHGQIRFSVPATRPSSAKTDIKRVDPDLIESSNERQTDLSSLGALFTTLEAQKEELGFKYYSISQTTLDQVFLTIVGKHEIEEENYGQKANRGSWWKRALKSSRD